MTKYKCAICAHERRVTSEEIHAGERGNTKVYTQCPECDGKKPHYRKGTRPAERLGGAS